MRAKLWPTGLIGRVSLVLFAAILLELVGSTLLFEQAELLSNDESRAQRISEELDAAARVLNMISPSHRVGVAETLSDIGMKLEWRSSDDGRPETVQGERSRALRAKIVEHEPSLGAKQLHLRADNDLPSGAVSGSFRLNDGSALFFKAKEAAPGPQSIYAQIWSIALLSGCVLLAALLVVRTLAAPLRMLVKATDAIGHGPSIHIDERGPREIKRVAKAFNAMQERIAKLVSDRTEALAAVSHDLRTPIGRLRLRAGFVGSKDEQDAFEADLSEMEAMLNGLLAYLGGETDPEKPRRTDVAALLTTLVHAAEDAGATATYSGPDHATHVIRSLAMKRAFSNIINNAIAYGNAARVTLTETDEKFEIVVDDDGLGIPDAEIEAVFEPFYRVDASRNLSKGGMGLGLAIVRQAVWREGGTIGLHNRPEGGLRVAIELPKIQKTESDIPQTT